MGIYAEYLDKGFNSADLNRERKKQLGRIAELRQRRVLVIVKGGVNLDHFGGAKVDQLVKG